MMASLKRATYPVATQPFGEWLRSIRESRQQPLRAVAAAAEMDQAHLCKVELGQRSLTPAQGVAIAKFFKLAPNEIEARRIVEKFRLEYADNPAAKQAINILHENPTIYGAKK
jgi:transcriptional regulator with XRE-family HTH domain